MGKRFKNLRDLRERNGYTLEGVAKKINISKSAYFDKEKGTREFTFPEMKALSELYNLSMDYLFEEDKEHA